MSEVKQSNRFDCVLFFVIVVWIRSYWIETLYLQTCLNGATSEFTIWWAAFHVVNTRVHTGRFMTIFLSIQIHIRKDGVCRISILGSSQNSRRFSIIIGKNWGQFSFNLKVVGSKISRTSEFHPPHLDTPLWMRVLYNRHNTLEWNVQMYMCVVAIVRAYSFLVSHESELTNSWEEENRTKTHKGLKLFYLYNYHACEY